MNSDPTTPSVDDGIHSILSSGKEKAIDRLEEWEQCVREHPTKALLGAVALGCILPRLPIRSIIVANVKILTALAPPALLAYGAAKLCEILQNKAEPLSPEPPVDFQSPREGAL